MNDQAIPKPNMTPMIDVVFQLLIFFLVSMKFKTLDMKIEAQLPPMGLARGPAPICNTVRVLARLKRVAAQPTQVVLESRPLGPASAESTWTTLSETVRTMRTRHVENGGDPSLIRAEVDADSRVNTGDVVRAIDAFLAADIENVTFTGTKMAALSLDALPSRR